MATVIKNPDDTITVRLTPGENQLLIRWAAEKEHTPAEQFKDLINGFLQNKRNDYRGLDGSAKQNKYDALSPTQQAQVDALLG